MAEGGVNFSDIHNSSFHADNVIGGNYTVIKNIVAGPDKLPTDYGTRIKNFLREYLGDEKNKVPFGGRAADLATLNQWLADPNAPACLFMSAEAGRGKSALLARWATYLQKFEDIEVVFIPISIRFETAAQEVFYTALAARLAVVYGDEVKYSQLSAEQWKGVADQYLQKSPPDSKQVVVIIDGLDEATGWQAGAAFIPLPLPERVRVVASKRLQANENVNASRYSLGWQDEGTALGVSLKGLDLSGVQEALISMGNPLDGLANKTNVIKALYHLTEGDPLLVRLYVEALVGYGGKAIHLNAEELGKIQPGLKGYFDKWMEQQRLQWEDKQPLKDKALQTLLAILGCALGPISRLDILNIAPDDSGLDSFTFEDTLAPMRRFIIGDGEMQGFVFSHPRLGYYFYERLTSKEQQKWNSAFITFGKGFLQELKASQKTTWASKEIEDHGYILQHYTAHLDRTNVPYADYYAFICHEWAQAWEALRGTYDGFLADVQKVWRKAESDPDLVKGMTLQVWCALCQSSIVALSSNIFPELLVGATQAGVVSKVQAIVLLKQTSTIENIAASVELFVKVYGDDLPFLKQFLDLGKSIKSEGYRTRVLEAVAPHLPVEVLDVARAIGDAGYRMKALVAVAAHLLVETQEDVYLETLDAARAIRDEGYHVEALVVVAAHLPVEAQTGVYLEALAAARAIRDERSRARALVAVAPHLPAETQTGVYLEALDAAQAIGNDGFRAEALAVVAAHLPVEVQTGVYLEALAAVLGIRNEGFRAEVLAVVAAHLPVEVLEVALDIGIEGYRARVLVAVAAHLPVKVLDAARAVGDERFRAEVLVAVAAHLPLEVLDAARAIGDEVYRARVLVAVAAHLPVETQTGVYLEALAAARAIGEEWSRARALVAVAAHLPLEAQTGVYLEALVAARAIGEEWSRARVLVAVAPHLPVEVLEAVRAIGDEWYVLVTVAPHLPVEVLEAARGIGDEGYRAEVLAAVAPHLPLEAQTGVYREALAAALDIELEGDRVNVLAAVAPHLPVEVLDVARAIRDEGCRAEVLAAVAPHLPLEAQTGVYREALDAALDIEDEWSRARALVAVAAHFPVEAQTDVYREALDAARATRDEWSRAEALAVVAAHLPVEAQTDVYRELLAAARAIGEELFRERALVAVAAHLPVEVLEAALDIGNEGTRTGVLAAVAPHLPVEVLEAARGIGDEGYRAEVLAAVAPHLPVEAQTGVYREALAAVLNIGNDRSRMNVLAAVTNFLISWAKQEPHQAKMLWRTTLTLGAEDPRPHLLFDLNTLMSFTLAFVDSNAGFPASPKKIDLAESVHQDLLALMQDDLELATFNQRTQLLENAGLASLRTRLDFQVPQDNFVHQLLTQTIATGNAPDGQSYLYKLLTYLQDEEWKGHPNRQQFLKKILGTLPISPAQQELARGILEAVQAVCSWWP